MFLLFWLFIDYCLDWAVEDTINKCWESEGMTRSLLPSRIMWQTILEPPGHERRSVRTWKNRFQTANWQHSEKTMLFLWKRHCFLATTDETCPAQTTHFHGIAQEASGWLFRLFYRVQERNLNPSMELKTEKTTVNPHHYIPPEKFGCLPQGRQPKTDKKKTNYCHLYAPHTHPLEDY